jgi:heme A synthase
LLTDPDFVDKGEFEKFARTLAGMMVFVVPLLASFFCRKLNMERRLSVTSLFLQGFHAVLGRFSSFWAVGC